MTTLNINGKLYSVDVEPDTPLPRERIRDLPLKSHDLKRA